MRGIPCQPQQRTMSQQILPPTSKPTPAPTQRHRPSPSPKLSRRAAATAIAIAAAPALLTVSPASSKAQEAAVAAAPAAAAPLCIAELPVTSKAFLDVSIGGEPAGRITVGLFGDAAPAGASRFLSLVTGVGYRRKEFVKIVPGYVQHGGVVSYPASPAVTDRLAAEAGALRARCRGGGGSVHGAAGAVSIVVSDPSLPPPKPKLVAKGGKLEVEEEQVGVAPNGTEFVITTKEAPELDASAVLVGRVLDGMDVVDKIAAVPTVKDNAGSPYFRVAKLIGDKRAVVAERGFNRPYTKVLVTNCGVLN
ncbi:peptidyl-prolyl cis-trans isomerase CYP26-2, chloroplastic-like [Phragmites australis]|uniref:peptidyl-prolyl cis-trans isomerase CYP26-2, chloroplastic-like n=1 Tax=Phragmites australis TaxID=29695 RepID=UPI002D7663EF|nr:peptidyl-prolyl cis-trans isomerase CYP26-2, chloroplastic-like [Phragmites australis]